MNINNIPILLNSFIKRKPFLDVFQRNVRCGLGTKSHDKQKCGEALRIVSGKTERVIKSLNHKTKKLIKRGNPLALAGG